MEMGNIHGCLHYCVGVVPVSLSVSDWKSDCEQFSIVFCGCVLESHNIIESL